jgi:hypothetical protein
MWSSLIIFLCAYESQRGRFGQFTCCAAQRERKRGEMGGCLRYYRRKGREERKKSRGPSVSRIIGRCGGNAGIRTLDRRIKSPLLYQLSYVPTQADCIGQRRNGGNAGIRTLDRRIKSPLLYQLSYVPIPDCPQIVVVGRAGLEPTTNGLKVRCSTN